MTTVTVPAIVDFEHEGRMFRRGESITVAPLVASMLARQGAVSIASGYTVPVVTPEKKRRGRPRVKHEKDPLKRAYQRRDLTAE